MFLRQGARDTTGRTAPVALDSWENPRPPRKRRKDRRPIKGGLTISQIATFVRREGYKTLALALMLFSLGTAVYFLIPARFAATALVVVDPREERVTNEQDVLPGIGQDSAALQSVIEIAKSDGFLRPLMERLNVAEDSDIAGSETEPARLLENFRKRIDINRRGLTYVIAMTFVSDQPRKAARYANAIADAFVASQTQVRSEATDGAADFLKSRLKSLSDGLRAAEDAVAAFKAAHRIVNAGRESTTRQLRVTELSQQVSAARLRAEDAKNRYEQAQRDTKVNIEVPSGSRTDILNVLRAQRTQLNDQIAQKRAVLGDRHPDLLIASTQLAELERQIDLERKRAIDGAKSDYETALEQQRSLEQQLKALESEMLEDGQAAVKLQELQRDADANRNIYELFLSRSKTTSEQRLFQTSQTKVASTATPPTRPTRPALVIFLPALAIGALLSAISMMVLIDALRSAKIISKKPRENPRQAPVATAASRISQKTSGRRGEDVRQSDWSPQDTQERPETLSSHLRYLLDTIGNSRQRRGKVVLVTSGDTGVGDSFAAWKLNASAVERGMLSVMIELLPTGALARDRQYATHDGLKNGDGVFRTDAHSLHLLLDPDPHAAVSSPLGDVRSEFDLIVVNAPSPAEQPDVATILAYVDHTIIVARGGDVHAPAINRARFAVARSGNSSIAIVASDEAYAGRFAANGNSRLRDRVQLAT